MALFAASDDLKEIVDDNEALIKEQYFTYKLFVDSAVRDKLRKMGVKGVGEDEVVAHIQRLQENKSRRHGKQALLHKKRNIEKRISRRRKELDEPIQA